MMVVVVNLNIFLFDTIQNIKLIKGTISLVTQF